MTTDDKPRDVKYNAEKLIVEALRLELQHEYKFSKFKMAWATDFRRAVFVENREEISKLIEKDILNRIKYLEDCNQEFDHFRYSPGGDRYQDIVRSNDQALAMCQKLSFALHTIMLEGTTSQGNTVSATMAYEALAEYDKWKAEK